MKKWHRGNQHGSMVLSLTVMALAMVSGLTLASLGVRDSGVMLMENEGLQQFHFVRGELQRGQSVLDLLTLGSHGTTLPYRKLYLDHGFMNRTYITKTTVARSTNANGDALTARKKICTKVKSFNRRPDYVSYSSNYNKDTVERYGEKVIQRETFAGYMYLTNTDQSVNDDDVYFNGNDEIWGRVHSNSDIHIQDLHGLPVFHDLVTTAGEILPQEYATDAVFLGGFREHAEYIEFNPNADNIKDHGQKPWGLDGNGAGVPDIVYMQTGDGGASTKLAWIENGPEQHFVLYDNYPPFGPVGDSIGVNVVALKDTVWTEGPNLQVDGSSVWIPTTVWIRGTTGGRQTYGSAGNMYLVGDLAYRGTSLGSAPDDPQHPNTSDILGLVSEQSIIVKYGMLDPVDSLRKHVNCAETANHRGIYIYGALCALADAADDHLDGVFTFEYQHPHRSTEPTWYQGERFRNIDMHLAKYPPSLTQHWPWPAATASGFDYPAAYGTPAWPDYPWYNPIWPEYNPYMERGIIYLFGSVAQQRRGFVHRGDFDSADMGYWDPQHWYYGQSIVGQDAPFAQTHTGSGYGKSYHYDSRFVLDPPPDFPEVSIRGQANPYTGIALRLMRPPRDF